MSDKNLPSNSIQRRIERVREQIGEAAGRAGRDPSSIKLIAVSKTHPAEDVAEAVAAGIEDVGENRVQEAAGKVERVRELLGGTSGRRPRWHLIGTLQRNKARQALELFDLIHSIDSVRLAEALAARTAQRDSGRVPLLLEVYLGDDLARPGLRPAEVADTLTTVAAMPGLEVRGLMTVAPLGLDPSQARTVFRRLRELRDRLAEQFSASGLDADPGVTLSELSMGMSEDFELAVEEGATMIRVGRAIFGERS